MPRGLADPRPDRRGARRIELKLVKINIDEEPDIAERYGIASIPTMVLFEKGEPAAAAIGAQPKGAIETQLGLEPGRDERLLPAS